MKTNHRDGTVDKKYTRTYLKRTLLGPLGPITESDSMVHHGPGQKGFRGAKRGSKRAGNQALRRQYKEVIDIELETIYDELRDD